MSFPRAPIKRFNETADTTIPAPGAYDPKFVTDVAVSSTLKGIVFEKWNRNNGNGNGKTRPEDIEPSQWLGRLSRDPSFTRRSSTIVANSDMRKRDPSASQNTLTGKPRPKAPSSLSTNNPMKRAPSRHTSSSSSIKPPVIPEVQLNFNKSHSIPNQSKSTHKIEVDTMICQDAIMSIHEIQTMAEDLQVEVSEYKRRLTEELIRNQELEANKLELEFTIQSLRRELNKYESAKEAWQTGEESQKQQMKVLNLTKAELEQEISNLQKKWEIYNEEETKLRERIASLGDDKLVWQGEKLEYEVALKEAHEMVHEQESKLAEKEVKCNELVAQMDSCYHMCESRMADAENMKEISEVKVQELTQEKEDLQKELDNVRRELETERTLLELMKSEQPVETNKQDNYIS